MQPLCDDYFAEIERPRLATPARVNAATQAYLRDAREHVLSLHDRRRPARSVNAEHSDLVDRLIRKLFRLTEDRYFEENARLRGYRIAVVATGGYGRREMALGSDVDLLFLHRGKSNPYVETLTEAISHRLWDARLVLGGAVRTPAECIRLGRADLPTLTSYLDARFLIGDTGLYADLMRRVHKEIHGDPRAFVEAKLAEQRERHERYGESAYLLQPNVRESVGGLRDYQTALWVARATQWEVRRFEHLQLHGFIDAEELGLLADALDFLWRLRNELHRPGRKDDRLHFEAQARLAVQLGFPGGEHELPIEQLMKVYYRSARTVERVSERARDHALALVGRRGRRSQATRPVEDGFAIAGGRLEIPRAELLEERPARVLAAFAVAQQHDVPLSARAERLIRQHVPLLDDAFRKDPESARLLLRILRGDGRVYRTLVQMNDLGVLGAMLPEFAHLVGLWQQDHYHTFTVDVHSLFLVEQLRRLRKGRFADELPLATELVREVADPALLFLACVLHDIGKGRGGGHSARGAALVPELGRRLGLDDDAIDDLRFLVLHHLTMSSMAERRDVHDSRTILNLANIVGSRARLRNLYLTTVADVRSVSPEAWTTWKGGLLGALYRNTAEWLETGASDAAAPGFFLQRTMERVARVEAEATERLAAAGVPREEAESFLASMPRRYLLLHGSSEIAEHVEAALAYAESGKPASVSLFRPESGEQPFFGLVVTAPDRPGLLALMTGVLLASGRDILGAQIYTTRTGLAVQIYEVAPFEGRGLEEEAERERLERRLVAVLEGRQDIDELIAGRLPQPGAARAQPPDVRITNADSDFYTIIDVAATDRPGLLHDITRALSDAGIDVFMSRVSTRARRVNDSFYVTEGGSKVLVPERQAELETALLRAIERIPA